jgi:predicted nucleotidyltransferase
VDIDASEDPIKLHKALNELDKLVIDFVKILNESRINYVLVSGYVSILFGRSRSSEDIDLIVEKMLYKQFHELWSKITERFYCLVPDNPKSAHANYLTQSTSIRFAKRGEFLPNIEFMFPKAEELDNWVLQNAREVILNGTRLRISPFELQIAYKLFLGSDKDIEDARHLYKMFKDNLDDALLRQFLIKLDKQDRFNKYLT